MHTRRSQSHKIFGSSPQFWTEIHFRIHVFNFVSSLLPSLIRSLIGVTWVSLPQSLSAESVDGRNWMYVPYQIQTYINRQNKPLFSSQTHSSPRGTVQDVHQLLWNNRMSRRSSLGATRVSGTSLATPTLLLGKPAFERVRDDIRVLPLYRIDFGIFCAELIV